MNYYPIFADFPDTSEEERGQRYLGDLSNLLKVLESTKQLNLADLRPILELPQLNTDGYNSYWTDYSYRYEQLVLFEEEEKVPKDQIKPNIDAVSKTLFNLCQEVFNNASAVGHIETFIEQNWQAEEGTNEADWATQMIQSIDKTHRSQYYNLNFFAEDLIQTTMKVFEAKSKGAKVVYNHWNFSE